MRKDRIDLVIAGTIAFDRIRSGRLYKKNIVGGNSVYSAYASSFLVKTGIIGAAGYDFQEYLKIIERRGIDTSGVNINKNKKTAIGIRNYKFSHQSRDWDKSTFSDWISFELTPSLYKVPSEYKNSNAFFIHYLNGEVNDFLLKELNSRVIGIDVKSGGIRNEPEYVWSLIERANLVTMNEDESRLLCKTYNVLNACRKILSKGPELVIVKRGENGATMLIKNRFINLPAYPTSIIIDPTGCGDSFDGGFMGYLLSKKIKFKKIGEFSERTIKMAAVLGNVFGSLCVEDFGGERIRQLKKYEIERRFGDYVDMLDI